MSLDPSLAPAQPPRGRPWAAKALKALPAGPAAGVARTVLRAVLLAFEAVERRAAWLLLRLGWPVRVHPFSGFGTGGWALLGGRVLVEAPPRVGDARSSRWAVLRSNLLPFLSVEVPGARVRVTLGEREVMARADREGYLQVRLEDLHLPPGRHQVTLTPVRPAGKPALGVVHVPDPAADVAVVSDVDDTIVDSGIAHGLGATLRTMLLQEQSTRVPLTGAPELYRALAQGTPGTVERPFFYLSTSPWNLVGYLQGFLTRHRFPDGPLVLTDWGPGADSLLRVSSRTHKLSTLRQLAQALPHSRFVLIGDSGQQDPAIYADFCAEHPGRVLAVYIRRAGTAGDQRVEQAERLLDEAGVPFVLAEDTDAMLRHAVELGLVAPS
ncbi:MAG TPA: App1 family protein [Jatrophihabitans sp.]|uniref:App1 family protein n=1 Tax=Jatrophihabitans sp. TaxID=1932789 RepID=UPI002F0148F2